MTWHYAHLSERADHTWQVEWSAPSSLGPRGSGLKKAVRLSDERTVWLHCPLGLGVWERTGRKHCMGYLAAADMVGAGHVG